jgi:hypothetical protein
MIFKRKDSFFLDLSGGDQGQTRQEPAAVQVAVAAPAPAAPKSAAPAASSAATGTVQDSAPSAAQPAKPTLTTAEALAAELRAAQESRPAPSKATFAPDNLNPANAVPSRRRTAGANLAGFKAMAAEMFKS